MLDLVLQICGFETLNRGGWMNINVLVVMLSVAVGAVVYALSNLLPAERRNKLKGIANYEMLEAFLSLVIIIVLILFSDFACNAGAALVGQQGYNNLFSSVENYLGNLLFVNGLSTITQLYTTSIQFSLVSNLVGYTLDNLIQFAQTITGFGHNVVTFSVGEALAAFLGAYSGIFTKVYGTMLLVTFGMLFIPLLALPIIEAGALTVVAPVAIITRSLAFFGPQFRSVSNILIALAVGFYFVFPLTIALNSYVASCLGIVLGIQQSACSGYTYFSNYLGGAYALPDVSSGIFSNPTALPVSSQLLPSFLQGSPLSITLSLPQSYFGTAGLGNLGAVFNAPSLAESYGRTVAAYLFVSTVMLAIDIAITVGFVQGVAKGLDSISALFGAGGFWG